MTKNLANFTDVLCDDVISDSQQSQPISLPSSIESCPQLSNNKSTKRIRPAKGTGQCNEFRSVEEIDTKYRNVFSYPFFNLVQSKVIEDALYSDKSLVVCAPTGSGKTVVFEMAIVQLLMEVEEKNRSADFKIIYMAPVKALCTERLTEWYSKFTRLGLLCIEVTGDTDVDFSQLQAYKIIITTPEKWDMLTRRWKDHRGLVEMIKLFLIDEVHILNDETRGPVLEAVVSRMKTIQSAAQSALRIEKLQKLYQNRSADGDNIIPCKADDSEPTIRFVAVSATVSNPEDVAAWLKTDDKPAVYYKFGDECRPVKLRRVVEGYPCTDGTSIFKFDIILNYKLWPIIQKYHDGKPTLIFCNTRKSVLLTAETLSREITITFSPEQKMKLTALASNIKTKKLQSLVLAGVGCHHAGMLYEERTYIEYAFRNGDLPILITTTTLAMGVNLPAHLVIIKNTQQYVNGAYQEYSISTILQMVGRAGRPQFDTDATAVIMTRQRDKARYQALAGGSEPLQSYLHKRLAENLNSETALGTVCDVAQCVQWLRSTFLYVRAARDPKRYLGLTSSAPDHLILKKIEELCVRAMNGLASAGLITMDEASCIESTEAGRLMSVFYLDLETMKLIMKIQGNESLERLLWIICECHELADMHLRIDERRTLNTLNRNNAAATIRFPMKGKISTRQMKLNCIIQAILGCLQIPDPSLNQEAMKIMRIADRICKCLVAYVTRPEPVTLQLQYFSAVLNTIILAKCIAAHLWENSPYVSKQLKGIGPTFSTLLASAGKVNFTLLLESHPRDLERIMNKGPPAGNVLRKQVSLLPRYQLEATPVDERTVSVKLFLLNQAYLSENMENLTAGPTHKCYVIAGDSENHILLLTTFTDKDLIRVYDGIITYTITRKHSFEHKISIHCASSNFAGVDAQCEFTFTSLMPARSYNVGVDSSLRSSEGNTKKNLKKHPNLSDMPKERKRKNNNDEISQSKEKKKRENAFTEKCRLLRESFGRTTTALKKNLQKTEEITKNVLNNLGYSDQPINESISNKNNHIHTIISAEDFDESNIDINFTDNCNDFMDDAKIDSILSEIETEITLVNNEPKEQEIDFNKKYFDKNKERSSNKTINKFYTGTKSNFKFLDLLEKNVDLNEDNIPVKETGFSDAIKLHVEKFIQKSYKAPPTIDLAMSNLYQNPKSTDITSSKVNLNNEEIDDFSVIYSITDFQQNSNAEKDKNKDLHSHESNNENLDCAYETNTNEDMNGFVEDELPEVNVTESITKLAPTNNFGLRDIVEKHEYNERWDYPSTGDIGTINNLNNSLHTFCNKSIDESETPSITGIKLEPITYNNSNTKDKDTKELSFFPTDKNIINLFNDNDKVLHELQSQLVLLDQQPSAITVANQFSMCNNINNLSLWSQQINKINIKPTNNLIPNEDIRNRQAEILTKTQLNSENHILHSKQSMLHSNLDQQNRSTDLGATKDRSTEYENKYSFSAEKVNVQTKYTADHKIRVIRRLKVDLDVKEIVSQYDRENINESQTFFNKPVSPSNISSTRIVKNLTPSRFEAKNATHTQRYIISKESPKILSIAEGIKNTNEALKVENTQKENKEKSKGKITHEPKDVTDTAQEGNRKPDDGPTSKDKSIGNILEKYSQIIRNNNLNNDVKKSPSPLASKVNNIQQAPLKPSRPFKITEIENLKIPLPFFSENVNPTPSNEPHAGNVQFIITNHTETPQTTREIQNSPEKPLEYVELTPCQSPEQMLEQSFDITEADFKIDQSMFNPKTLLQNMGKDDMILDIIPPPPEFCNDEMSCSLKINNNRNLNSPSDFEDINHTVEEIHNTSIFEDVFPDTSNLTPSKEIETWIMDRDNDIDDSLKYTNPTQSYTVMRRKMLQNYKAQDTDSTTRQGRLSQFQFKCKNKFKM